MELTRIQAALGVLVLAISTQGFAQDPAQRPGSELLPQSAIPQFADPGSFPSEAVMALSDERKTRVFTAQHGEDFWARGASYKTRFHQDATTFIPLLGPDAMGDDSVSFEAPVVRVGAESIGLASTPRLHTSDQEVRLERGPVTEWYKLSPQGIEQLFTFERSLGSGPLSVTIPVQSQHEPTPLDGGFAFLGDAGGVHYGAATVLDATGASLALESHWTGSGIQILVPETFLANAQWPVTIDPLITTITVDTWVDDLTNPDIAYDATNDTLLAVYEESAGGADRDIYWRLFTASTNTLLSSGYFDVTTENWFRPRVANNSLAGAFLIVAEVDLGSSRNVGYQTIDALDGTAGLRLGVSSIEFVSNETPDVGGEDFPMGASYWYVTWVQEDFMGNRRVMATRVDSDGVCLFDELPVSTASTMVYRPAIANNAKSTSLWDVVWESGPIGARTIRGAMLLFNGTVSVPDHLIADLPGDVQNPSVSGFLDGGNLSLVVYEEIQGAGDVDIFATVQNFSSPVLTQSLTEQAGINLTASRGGPRVDNDFDSYVVVWSEEVAPGNFDVLASTYHLQGNNLCESESRVALHFGGDPQSEIQPSVCSLSTPGGVEQVTYGIWSLLEPGTVNIYAARYDMPASGCLGRSYCNPAVQNSSAQFGRLIATGSHIAVDNNVTLTADQMPPNQFGYFVCGTGTNSFIPPGSQGRLCLGGTLGRYNRTVSEILFSGPWGTFDLVIDTSAMPTNPNQPILTGQTWNFQAWHRDLNPGQTSNFTRAVSIQFE